MSHPTETGQSHKLNLDELCAKIDSDSRVTADNLDVSIHKTIRCRMEKAKDWSHKPFNERYEFGLPKYFLNEDGVKLDLSQTITKEFEADFTIAWNLGYHRITDETFLRTAFHACIRTTVKKHFEAWLETHPNSGIHDPGSSIYRVRSSSELATIGSEQ